MGTWVGVQKGFCSTSLGQRLLSCTQAGFHCKMGLWHPQMKLHRARGKQGMVYSSDNHTFLWREIQISFLSVKEGILFRSFKVLSSPLPMPQREC